MVKIALSGSGAFNFPIWVGVFKFLDEQHIPIKGVVGSSGGGLVGALRMCGIPAKEIEQIVLKTDIADYISTSWFKLAKALIAPRWLGGGYINNGKKIEKFIESLIGSKKFMDVPGLAITATDVINDHLHFFNFEDTPEASVATAIRATISIPIVFNGVEYRYSKDQMKKHGLAQQKVLLYDGGIRNNFPIDYFGKDPHSRVLGYNIKNGTVSMNRLYNIRDILGLLISNMVDATEVKHKEDVGPNTHWVDWRAPTRSAGDYFTLSGDEEQKKLLIYEGYKLAQRNWDWMCV